MDFSPDHWAGALQLGMALFALVGGLIICAALIMIGLNSSITTTTTTTEEEHDHDHGCPR